MLSLMGNTKHCHSNTKQHWGDTSRLTHLWSIYTVEAILWKFYSYKTIDFTQQSVYCHVLMQTDVYSYGRLNDESGLATTGKLSFM